MYLEAEIARSTLGAVGDDAWTAISKKGEQKNFGTSKQDIDDYAAAGGAVIGGAACAEAGPLAIAACAEGGSLIASFAADTIQTIGAALFGGDEFRPQPNDTWNPVADSAIKGVVKALRLQKGLEISSPPGGSWRKYPEWDGVAVVWARHVNDFITARGGPIKWFYDTVESGEPGRIRQAAIDQWQKCGGYWVANAAPHVWNSYAPSGHFELPPASECKNAAGESASKYLPEATVVATQQTMTEVLSGGAAKSSTASTVLKVGAVAGIGAAVWYFREPILAFASRILKR
jgi:hypothetical protein